MWYNSILETIGNTPMIAFNKITKDIPGTILAKIDTFNPGNSIKDRMALQMIIDAEAEGKIKPGGTIIEGTSGNTGMGLALVCIARGYKLICTMSDKQSKEKVDILRAVGAEVIVCPTDVEPEDPRSYYSVARRLETEIPNSYYVNQYDNLSNTKAHYLTTGPEIWEQTEGKITHLVVGVGTGGTISGTGRFLKEKNPNIKLWGIDTYGSVFKKYHETGIFDKNEIYPYSTEGIGEDILPKNVDFSIIDHFEKVTDKDAAIMTRRLAREEGFFVGNSCGSAVQGLMQLQHLLKPTDLVVVIFHDSGTRYIGKIFNDDWMRDRGFMDSGKQTAQDIINRKGAQKLVFATKENSVKQAINLMTENDISQLPIMENNECVGTVHEKDLFKYVIEHQDNQNEKLEQIVKSPLPVISPRTTIEEMSGIIDQNNPAMLVKKSDGTFGIITRHDIIKSLGNK